jgi:hypothetical protein
MTYVDIRFSETVDRVMAEAAGHFNMSPDDLTVYLSETTDPTPIGQALRTLWSAMIQAHDNCKEIRT